MLELALAYRGILLDRLVIITCAIWLVEWNESLLVNHLLLLEPTNTARLLCCRGAPRLWLLFLDLRVATLDWRIVNISQDCIRCGKVIDIWFVT